MFTEDGDFSLTVKSSCWPKGVDVPPASELGQFIQSFNVSDVSNGLSCTALRGFRCCLSWQPVFVSADVIIACDRS